MNEGMNNNEFQNSNLNNNNFDGKNNEKDKNVLIVFLSIIILLLVLLLVYVLVIKDKNTNNQTNKNNNINNSTVEKTDNNKEENANIKTDTENFETYKKIDYEVKKYDYFDGKEENAWMMDQLYINNKRIVGVIGESLDIKNFKDLLLVEAHLPGFAIEIFAVDKDGNVTKLNFIDKDTADKSAIISYKIEKNNIYISLEVRYTNGYSDYYCRIKDINNLDTYEVKYEYLGNGKFNNPEIVNKKTIADNYKNKDCSDVDIFTDLINENEVCTRYNNSINCFKNDNFNNEVKHLKQVFGESNCKYSDNNSNLYCSDGDYACSVSKDKNAYCFYKHFMCSINEDNIASCGKNGIDD